MITPMLDSVCMPAEHTVYICTIVHTRVCVRACVCLCVGMYVYGVYVCMCGVDIYELGQFCD